MQCMCRACAPAVMARHCPSACKKFGMVAKPLPDSACQAGTIPSLNPVTSCAVHDVPTDNAIVATVLDRAIGNCATTGPLTTAPPQGLAGSPNP